jgi:hypothetical protein
MVGDGGFTNGSWSFGAGGGGLRLDGEGPVEWDGLGYSAIDRRGSGVRMDWESMEDVTDADSNTGELGMFECSSDSGRMTGGGGLGRGRLFP